MPWRGARRQQGDFRHARSEATAVPSSAPAARWPIVPAAGLIVLCAVAAYHNSFAGTFLYDDLGAILENHTIRHLWPLGQVLSPPTHGETVGGRPLLNLSLAINYAIGGLEVWGYHAANLAIHIAAALLLMGILRRTFLSPVLQERFGGAATLLALASTLLWTVHLLQVESVTYIVQRAESLAGFFYLLTLYSVIRGAGSGRGTVPFFAAGTVPFFAAHKPQVPDIEAGEKGDCPLSPGPPRLWYTAAVLACLLGMACKEVMATAPVMVLLYDRTFLAGSFAEAWRRRWGLYVGLAATWGMLAYLVLSTGLMAHQTELGAPDLFSYARTQPGVIWHYLRLSVWPKPLCLDYVWPVASGFWEVLPGAAVVGLLAATTVWGLIRRKAWSFLGAWFFLILAPTSSIFPLAELAFEHRMYLPSAAVAVLGVTGGYALCDRLLPRPTGSGLRAAAVRWGAPMAVLAAVLAALGCTTVARNSDYRSPVVFWQDTVKKHPASYFAHCALGNALAGSDRTAEAIEHYQKALLLKPEYATAYNNLGLALAGLGRTAEAIEQYQRALLVKPEYATSHNNLGKALDSLGRRAEALEHYQQALLLRPDYAAAHNNLGLLLAGFGRTAEAVVHYHQALLLNPDDAEAHSNLGNALHTLGKPGEAIQHCQEALRLKGDYAEAHNNLAASLMSLGRTGEAIRHCQEALRLKPDCAEAHNNLAAALVGLGRTAEAIEHYYEALRLKPDYPDAQYNLACALAAAGRTHEAIAHYNQFLRLVPNSIEVIDNLAWLLATREPAEGGDPARAVELAERACELAGQENIACLDTLAAAYAAAGRFDDAVTAAERAVQLAESAGQASLAKLIRQRLELYRAGRPYREASQGDRPCTTETP
jgi:tetratricopeptide (TPR) repeat protein